ncbi:MAG: DUF1684 domain-containing protein [Chloroflexota bacterium]
MPNPDLAQKLSDWRAEMDASLRAENSWLALAGLFWLAEGETSFGSDPANALVLPGRAPARLGSFHRNGSQVRVQARSGGVLQINGRGETEAILQNDQAPSPSYVEVDGMRMVVIERPRGIGIRLWDNLRPERKSHPPRVWFPFNEAFRVPALYIPYPQPKPVQLPDTFGDTLDGFVDGQVQFGLGGAACTLDVTRTPEGKLSIQFRDATSGRETYPSGRYYVTDEPVVDGVVTLDFNHAFSPPCAFTSFATCVFAPAQNHLPVRVEAGERFPGHA